MQSRIIIFTLVSILCLFTLAVKRKAEIDDGSKKITDFFSRDRQPKKTKLSSIARCPASNCDGEMKERKSQSASNPGRLYQKCEKCETFRWKGSLNFCDKSGVWTFREPRYHTSASDIEIDARCRHHMSASDIEIVEMNRQLRIADNYKFLADFHKWKKNGEWDQFDEQTQKRLSEQESHIQRDISW